MSTSTATVPATALSRYYQANVQSKLVIGDHTYGPGSGNGHDPNAPFFWYTVVGLRTLNVAVNVISSDETSVPPDVQRYAGNSGYFLYFITNVVNGYNIPQGNLYTFLKAVGSGPQLKRAEQMIHQLGTSTISKYSYVLAATMDETDAPGFEMFSNTEYVVLTMQFLPVTVDGRTVYAPIQS
jgi:hypothetical protein